MKRQISIVIFFAVLFLAGCIGVDASVPTPVSRATPLAPGVSNEMLPSATPTATETPAEPTDAPPPTATAAQPTATEAAPTLAPEQPTLAPEEPTATPQQPTPTVAAPTPTTAPVTPPSGGADAGGGGCVDKAAFYDDVTIPDNTSFKQNIEFVKTWQIKNEGSCTWDGYNLVFGGGSIMNAPLENPMPVVKPGELANISVKLTSPVQGGLYTGLWEFQNKDGKRFGVNSGGVDYIWVKISVTWYPEGSTDPGVTSLPAPSGCAVETKPNYIVQVLALINKARADKGLSALEMDNTLNDAAQGHSEDMACKDFTAHVGSDGKSWNDRIKRAGYKFNYASENIFYGDPNFADPAGAVEWWLNSPIHYANIMSPKVTQIGIGYALYPKSTYQGYYTVNFARP